MPSRHLQHVVALLLVGSTIVVTGCSGSSDADPAARSTVAPADAVDEPAPRLESLDGLVLVPDLAVNAEDVAQYELQAAQTAQIASRGQPDRFLLQFLRTDDDAGVIRQETWYYDDSGARIAFHDGEPFSDRIGTPVELDGLASTPYRPEWFTAEMTLDDLLAVTGEDGYAQQIVDQAIATDGKLVFITGAVAGFDAGRLTYIETIPIDTG